MPMQNLQRGGKKLEGGGAMDGAPLCLNMKNDWIIVMDNDMQMKAPLVSVTTTRAMVHAHLASLQHPRDVATYMMTKLDGAMLRIQLCLGLRSMIGLAWPYHRRA